MGKRCKDALRFVFDRKLKIEFHGTKVTGYAGLWIFRDRFDSLLEKRPSGIAKRLIWEKSDYNAFLFLNAPAVAVEFPKDVLVIGVVKLIQQFILN